jgi:hypothetical protein
VALISLKVAEQCAYGLRFFDAGETCRLHRGKSTAQIGGDIPTRPACGYGIAENLSTILQSSMRYINKALGFNTPQLLKRYPK